MGEGGKAGRGKGMQWRLEKEKGVMEDWRRDWEGWKDEGEIVKG